MPCPDTTTHKRRLAILWAPARNPAEASISSLWPCTCNACHLTAKAAPTYTPGCRCDDCRTAHRTIHALIDAHRHLGSLRAIVCHPDDYYTAERQSVYLEVLA